MAKLPRKKSGGKRRKGGPKRETDPILRKLAQLERILDESARERSRKKRPR